MKKNLLIAIFGIFSFATVDTFAYVKNYCKYIPSSTPQNTYIATGFVLTPNTKVRLSSENNNFDTGYGVRAAYGADIDDFRIEGEIKYSDGAQYTETGLISDGSNYILETLETTNSQLSFMANGYYDINIFKKFSFFVTGGIGLIRDKLAFKLSNVGNYNLTDSVFAYKIGGGITYLLDAKLPLDLWYQYVGTSETDYGATIGSHDIILNARYIF